MRLYINQYALQSAPTEVLLEHNNTVLAWNIALFDRMPFSNEVDIFEQINGYWASLVRSTQDKIFDVYVRIREVFDQIYVINELTKSLYVLVKELYTYHDLASIDHWKRFHSNLILPEGLKDEFNESHETSGTRERTYLKTDYQGLVTLSIALRAMVPVWGEFISSTKRETGTNFKEYYAFKLLAHSSIYHSDAMERLRVYVEHSIPNDKSKSSAILEGISSEDFPFWILGLVVVRRLSVGDVRGTVPNSSLVMFIYNYIRQKVQGHDNSFMGMVKEKIIDGQGQEGENNLSKLEGYKIKQEIPAGDIVTIEHSLLDPDSIALRICPDLDLSLLRASQISVQVLATERIWEPQITIMQWVLNLKQSVSPRGILHLSKKSILQAMAITQALLWHRGHYELAALVSAIEQPNLDELHLGVNDSRSRILKEQQEQLDFLFPYSNKSVGKQKTVKRVNPATEAIESVCLQMSVHPWKLTLPQEWAMQVTGNKNVRRYAVPHDIKIKLASLAIAVAKRSF